MICLLLIMTMIFINSTETTEQKIRHSDTLLKEEDMNAKTKAWLLMVESGKVDQEELRRITPKSIFIAPLLTSHAGKCKEGYRHDHLGQCVKVIKIDPQVQLELLLQKLNKLYGDKQEQKEEAAEVLDESSGPLHFSLPISNAEENVNLENSDIKSKAQEASKPTVNNTASEVHIVPESTLIPLLVMNMNQTNQTKEIETSGAGPLNETESYDTLQFEGSGDVQSASGDGFQEEETRNPSEVSFLSEESDYFDTTDTESTTLTEMYTTTESPVEEFTSETTAVNKVLSKASYQNFTDIQSVNNSSSVLPKEKEQKESAVKNNTNSDKIYFPIDDYDNDDGIRIPAKPSVHGSRIRFPDEISQHQIPSYQSLPHSSAKSNKYQIHPSTIPREHYWWLPKNWQTEENQHKSALVKVWSRLPLIHDITYSHEAPNSLKKTTLLDESHPQVAPNPQHQDEEDSLNHRQHKPSGRILKPFNSNRFQDFFITPSQKFRFQR